MSTSMKVTPAAEVQPTTFADLDALCTPGRPLSGPAVLARKLRREHPEFTETEAVALTLAVVEGEAQRRRYFDARGLWTTAGDGPNRHIVLLPGDKPGPEDA